MFLLLWAPVLCDPSALHRNTRDIGSPMAALGHASPPATLEGNGTPAAEPEHDSLSSGKVAVIGVLLGCLTVLLIVLCVLCITKRGAIARTSAGPEPRSDSFTSEAISYTDQSSTGLLFFS
jgi:hypothetical protein